MSKYLVSNETALKIKEVWIQYLNENTTGEACEFSYSSNVSKNAVANLLYLLLTRSKVQTSRAFTPISKQTNTLYLNKKPYFNINFIARHLYAMLDEHKYVKHLEKLHPLVYKMFTIAEESNNNVRVELRESLVKLLKACYCHQDLSSWIN